MNVFVAALLVFTFTTTLFCSDARMELDRMLKCKSGLLLESFWLKLDGQPGTVESQLNKLFNYFHDYTIESPNVQRFLLRYLVLNRLGINNGISEKALRNSIVNSTNFVLGVIALVEPQFALELQFDNSQNEALLFFHSRLRSTFMSALSLPEVQMGRFKLTYSRLYSTIIQFFIANGIELRSVALCRTIQIANYLNAVHSVVFSVTNNDAVADFWVGSYLRTLTSDTIVDLFVKTAICEHIVHNSVFRALREEAKKTRYHRVVCFCPIGAPCGKDGFLSQTISMLTRSTALLGIEKTSLFLAVHALPAELKKDLLKLAISQSNSMVVEWLHHKMSIAIPLLDLISQLSAVNPIQARRLFNLMAKGQKGLPTILTKARLGNYDGQTTKTVFAVVENAGPELRTAAQFSGGIAIYLSTDILTTILEDYVDLATQIHFVPLLCQWTSSMDLWYWLKRDPRLETRFSEDIIFQREYILGTISQRGPAVEEFLLRYSVFTKPPSISVNVLLSPHLSSVSWSLFFEAFGVSKSEIRPFGFWTLERKEQMFRYIWAKLWTCKNEADFIYAALHTAQPMLSAGGLVIFASNLLASRSIAVLGGLGSASLPVGIRSMVKTIIHDYI